MHQKTAGNPFFVIQFLSALVEEGLITFDHGAARWRWDLAAHSRQGLHGQRDRPDGRQAARLPPGTQRSLRRLACLGNSADSAVLTMVYEDSEEELRRDLQDALRTGLATPCRTGPIDSCTTAFRKPPIR